MCALVTGVQTFALPIFNLAVDYFDIKVKGEIAQLGAANILFGCYDSENFPNEPLCDLFTRGQNNAPNNVDMVFDQFVNVARQRNSGVDVELNLRHDRSEEHTSELQSLIRISYAV